MLAVQGPEVHVGTSPALGWATESTGVHSPTPKVRLAQSLDGHPPTVADNEAGPTSAVRIQLHQRNIVLPD
jgi:hypothetical protein